MHQRSDSHKTKEEKGDDPGPPARGKKEQVSGKKREGVTYFRKGGKGEGPLPPPWITIFSGKKELLAKRGGNRGTPRVVEGKVSAVKGI